MLIHLPKLAHRVVSNQRYFTTAKRVLEKKYTKNEDWLDYKDNFIEVGITRKAIQQLGELIFIEFQNEIGNQVKEDEELVIMESVKATDSIKAPFDCKIIENNTSLEDDLDILNTDSENTWIVKIEKI